MISKFTAKGFRISQRTFKHLDFHLKKIIRAFPRLNPELALFDLLIKKSKKKYHLKRHHHHSFTGYSDRKGALAFFEGSINLRLPKKPLRVEFKGRTADECVDTGVKVLKKEVAKYKDLHYKSQSKYPNHDSIRKEGFYGQELL